MERHTNGRASRGPRVTKVPAATARSRTPAEAQRAYRAGRRAPGGKASTDPVWGEGPRNGMPVRLYVYRGGKPGDGPML